MHGTAMLMQSSSLAFHLLQADHEVSTTAVRGKFTFRELAPAKLAAVYIAPAPRTSKVGAAEHIGLQHHFWTAVRWWGPLFPTVDGRWNCCSRELCFAAPCRIPTSLATGSHSFFTPLFISRWQQPTPPLACATTSPPCCQSMCRWLPPSLPTARIPSSSPH